ncbi:hypothetical protein Y032_0224g2735 [Ancylostoma ceylanicum]|uniref:Uncharacterized protein n=1 Tax=Ancylostoma ceylanicum TaxID=53326 RepID=A0A016SI81_9BILA|nr:hypothetical protein Y032_0224g2735 [Ancylostoma ceylanicum]
MYLGSAQLDQQHPLMPCTTERSSWISPGSVNVVHSWMPLESARSYRPRTTMRGLPRIARTSSIKNLGLDWYHATVLPRVPRTWVTEPTLPLKTRSVVCACPGK